MALTAHSSRHLKGTYLSSRQLLPNDLKMPPQVPRSVTIICFISALVLFLLNAMGQHFDLTDNVVHVGITSRFLPDMMRPLMRGIDTTRAKSYSSREHSFHFSRLNAQRPPSPSYRPSPKKGGFSRRTSAQAPKIPPRRATIKCRFCRSRSPAKYEIPDAREDECSDFSRTSTRIYLFVTFH